MPGPNFVLDLPYKAAAAISQFQGVKLSADDTVTPVSALTDACIGVAQETISAGDVTSGRVCDIRVMGVTRAKSGGTCTRGTAAACNASGLFQNAATTNRVAGIFLTSGVSGDQVNLLLVPPVMLVP
jgi:hypothetical protein